MNIIGCQPLGRFGQRPELSQATGSSGMLHPGKFLGVVFHCFPRVWTIPLSPPSASTSATTREILAAVGGTVGVNDVR